MQAIRPCSSNLGASSWPSSTCSTEIRRLICTAVFSADLVSCPLVFTFLPCHHGFRAIFAVGFQATAIQHMAMFQNLKTSFLSNRFLSLLDSLVIKFLHTPAVRADQVIMVLAIIQL